MAFKPVLAHASYLSYLFTAAFGEIGGISSAEALLVWVQCTALRAGEVCTECATRSFSCYWVSIRGCVCVL